MISIQKVFCSFLLLFVVSIVTGSLYDGVEHIIPITDTNDVDTILKSESIWMIQLFNPDQKESKEIVDPYTALGILMRGLFPVAVLDVTNNNSAELAKQLSIKSTSTSTPSFYVVGDDKKKPIKIKGKSNNGLPDIQALAEGLMQHASNTVSERSKNIQLPPPGSSSSGRRTTTKPEDSKVVQLTTANFHEKVYNTTDVVAVAFTAPWCGHCKNLLPEWEEAAIKLYGSGAILGWVDATVETQLANQFKVEGYPTIKIFPGGKKSKKAKDAEDYNYERNAQTIAQYMLKMVDTTGPPPSIPEMISKEALEAACGRHNQICIIAALPHILDSGAAGREKYRTILSDVAKNFRGMVFSFLWFEYTSQLTLETSVELTFGAPALVAMSIDRKAYAVYRGSFNVKGITGFVHSIANGRQKTIPLPDYSVPKITSVTPWDGQDGKPMEEEIPLSEIMGEEF